MRSILLVEENHFLLDRVNFLSTVSIAAKRTGRFAMKSLVEPSLSFNDALICVHRPSDSGKWFGAYRLVADLGFDAPPLHLRYLLSGMLLFSCFPI